jgi:hypothetical protein
MRLVLTTGYHQISRLACWTGDLGSHRTRSQCRWKWNARSVDERCSRRRGASTARTVMLNTRSAPIARLRWPPVTTGLRWWPDPTGHRPPEIVHGQKPGDEYVRVSVHRRHCWRWPVRRVLHLVASACPMA